MKIVAAFVGLTAFATAAPGAMITGGLGFVDISAGPTYSGSSVANATEIDFPGTTSLITTALSGDFAAGGAAPVPAYSSVAIADLTGIQINGGLQPDAINSFLEFSTGTTPADRYQFDLSTLNATDSNNIVTLYGSGTIRDTVGSFAPTPATLTLSLISNDGTTFSTYNATFAAQGAVPEPASLSLLTGGALALLSRRRRLRA